MVTMNQNNIKPQELLAGKAKEAFEKWMYSRYDSVILREEEEIYWGHCSKEVTLWDVFEKLPIELQQASLIDWLDSVGIFIEISGVQYQSDEPEFTYNVNEIGTLNGYTALVFPARHQATQEAVKKAIQTYNERN